MGLVAAALGVGIIALASFDLFVTALTTRGGGPLSARISSWGWGGIRRLGRWRRLRRVLGFAGPLVALMTVLGWILMFWAGWTLIFSAAPERVVNSITGEPADLWARLYFSGYAFFTLGLGDYRPVGGPWQVLTAMSAGNGFLVISLSAAYLIPLVGASVFKRSIALQIETLGRSPEGILISAWDGSGLSGLGQQLASLSPGIIEAGQQQLAYPVLHHFQPLEAEAALPVQLARLGEALRLHDHGLAAQVRLPPSVTHQLGRAIGLYMEMLDRSQLEGEDGTPPVPDLALLRQAGLPVVSDAEFRCRLDREREHRRHLEAVVRHSGWSWKHVTGDPEVGGS